MLLLGFYFVFFSIFFPKKALCTVPHTNNGSLTEINNFICTINFSCSKFYNVLFHFSFLLTIMVAFPGNKTKITCISLNHLYTPCHRSQLLQQPCSLHLRRSVVYLLLCYFVIELYYLLCSFIELTLSCSNPCQLFAGSRFLPHLVSLWSLNRCRLVFL
jgi:hypothetical protein